MLRTLVHQPQSGLDLGKFGSREAGRPSEPLAAVDEEALTAESEQLRSGGKGTFVELIVFYRMA